MPERSKGQLEAEISETMTRFQREQMGRGPDEAKCFILGDLVVVRLRNVLTPAERLLAATPEGRRLIKEMRNQLLETSRAAIEDAIVRVTGCRVVSLHTDLSTRTGERVIVVTLDRDVEVT
ncbi:MAG: DUF2294 domain-containing protein [Armatimonadota bacterium]|nr:DUF2294 domain-containing protein [Armatimonadota bacterium]